MFEIHLLAIKFDIVISDMRGHGYKISIKIIKKEIKFWIYWDMKWVTDLNIVILRWNELIHN